MRFLLQVSAAIDRLSTLIARSSGWLILALIAVGALTTLLVKVGIWLKISLVTNAFLDTQWYLYGSAFLLFGAYNLKADHHVRVDILYDRFSPRGKAIINVIGSFVFLFPTLCVLLWFTSKSAHINFLVDGASNGGGLPRWPMRIIVVVAFGLLFLQALSELIKNMACVFGVTTDTPEEPAAEVSA